MQEQDTDLVHQLMEVAITRMKTAAHGGLDPQTVEDAELELRGFVWGLQNNVIPKELIPSRLDRLTQRVFKSGVDSPENHLGYLRMAIDMAKPGFHWHADKREPVDNLAYDAKLMETYLDKEIEPNATFGFKRSFYDLGMKGLDPDIHVVSKIDTVPSQNLEVSRLKRAKTFKNPEGFDDDNHYFVSHDADGTIHHVMKFGLDGLPNDSTVREILVGKNPNSDIPATEFYGHLLNNDINILSDDTHSPGAQKLWDRLQGLGYGHKILNAKDNSEAFGVKNPYQKLLPTTKDTKNTKHLRYLFKPAYPDFLASGPKDEAAPVAPQISEESIITEETLNEVFISQALGKESNFGHDIFFGKDGIHDAREYLQFFHKEHDLGDLDQHTKVSMFTEKGKGGYVMSHDKNGVVHHVIQFRTPYENKNTLVISSVSKNPKAYRSTKAADLYAHLVHAGHVLQSDDIQSKGSLDVWRKLTRKPGVSVHAWDMKNDRPVNTDRNLRSLDDSHVEVGDYLGKGIDPEDKEEALHRANHIALIAHQK